MTILKPRRLTPEELYTEAVNINGQSLTEGELCLLTKGLRFLQENQIRRINEAELNAIKNLISYASYTQEASEKTVISILTAHYGVEEPQDIPAHFYDDVVEFLVDLKIRKVIN